MTKLKTPSGVKSSLPANYEAPRLVLGEMGHDAGGWRTDRHPRGLADVNGDGVLDAVGFAEGGVIVAVGNGVGFAGGQLWSNAFGASPHAGGWGTQNPRFLADMNGDGLSDVVGFANAGVVVALSTGGSFAAPQLWAPSFGLEAGLES